MDHSRALQTAKVLTSACTLILDLYSETFTEEDITNSQLLINAEDADLVEWVQYLVNGMGEGEWVARACFVIVSFFRDLWVARSRGVVYACYAWFYGLVSPPGGLSDLASGIIASFTLEDVGLAAPVREYMNLYCREEWLSSQDFTNSLRLLETQTESTDRLYYSFLLSLTPQNLTNWQRGALAARAAADSGRILSNDRFGLMEVRSRPPRLTKTLIFDIEPTRDELDSLTPFVHLSKSAIWQESPHAQIGIGSLVAGATGHFRRTQARASVPGRGFRMKVRREDVPRWEGPITMEVVSDYGRTFLPESIEEDTAVIREMMRKMRSGVSNRWECWALWKQYVQTKYPALYEISENKPHGNKIVCLIERVSDARGVSNVWFNRLFEHYGEQGILILVAARQICIQISGYAAIRTPAVQIVFCYHPPGIYDDVAGAFIESNFGLTALQGIIHLAQKQRDRFPGLHYDNLTDSPVLRPISQAPEDDTPLEFLT